ncbi:hypothetical protein GCM10027418_25930 [Mariniluteicoccus endophyticus]
MSPPTPHPAADAHAARLGLGAPTTAYARGPRALRLHEHGLVAAGKGVAVGGRWCQMGISRTESPEDTFHCHVAGAKVARAVLASGGTRDFSGWFVSRTGVRTPVVQARRGEVWPRVSEEPSLTGMRRRVRLVDAAHRQVDVMEIHDAERLEQIFTPAVGTPR